MSIKNSRNAFINDEDTRKILTEFLEGDLSLKELQEALSGFITIKFDLAPDQRVIKDIHINEDVKIQVKKEHLCKMIRKYINGKISDNELSNWAAFIFMAPFFMPEGDTEEDRWKEGENITWEIIQKITSPILYIEINPIIAENYIKQLSCGN